VWEKLYRGNPRSGSPGVAGAIGCETCGLVSVPRPEDLRCPRCDSALHERKPNSVARTWALVIAAAVLYIPANYYPVLSVVQLGAGQPSTILGGVEELVTARQYPLAALVFFASIAVPMLKLFGLSIMLITIQTGRMGWLRDRTRLYHIVRFVGRWSMIAARRAGRVRLGDHDRARRRRPRLLRRRDPDHVRGRNLRPAADVGCGGGAGADIDTYQSAARRWRLKQYRRDHFRRSTSPIYRNWIAGICFLILSLSR
jgi:hypothetical protein